MDIKQEIREKGYIFLPEWNVNKSTLELAKLVGSVMRISNFSGLEFIPDVQVLRPREKSDLLLNQYSGQYGLDKFPLHTDLAHWSRPPQYLLLRCLKGFLITHKTQQL
jgi:L-asparagine oxygenase